MTPDFPTNSEFTKLEFFENKFSMFIFKDGDIYL